MLIDGRSLPPNEIIKTDVCIIGAGAAGITLAREVIGRPFRVCLLESGGLEFDAETQLLYQGENVGLPYFPLDGSRLRYFGGTTNHWGGYCWPFDEIDFQTREWVPHSGWPFGKAHLVPYYERAQSLCQLGPFNYDGKFWEDPEERPRLPFKNNRVITKMNQIVQQLRFGSIYRDEITHADNISTYLHANVLDIETTDNAKTVTRLAVASLEGNKFFVSAKQFILATGGIENARLLLLSNQVQSGGLGNQYDLVGRFFMEHPYIETSFFLPSNPHIRARMYSRHIVGNTPIKGALTLSEDVQRREQLLNYSCVLLPMYDPELEEIEGVASAKHIYHAIRRGEVPGDFWKHLGNVIADIDDVSTIAYTELVKGIDRITMFKLANQTEQAPNPNSRVTLADERDKFGKNRVRLNWLLSEAEKRTIRRAQEIIAQEVGRIGLGRMRITIDDDDTTWTEPSAHQSHWSGPQGSFHHMGTTRMHLDPHKGVVDANCKVHGISNLFIAGSSVFPTVGNTNPTITIVALAVKLADHVKKLMR